MKKIVITFGIIAGIITSAMLVLLFTTEFVEMENGEWLGYSSMIIAFSTIFFAIRSYRDQHLGGFITFGKAFRIGLYITLIASTIYVVSWMVISETAAKDFMDNYQEQAIEKLKESGLSQEELDEKIKEMESFNELYKNPVIKAGITYLEILPVGLLISLISAGFLKRKNTLSTENNKSQTS